jgi:hypothetical protein
VSLSDKRWKKVRAGTSFSLALEGSFSLIVVVVVVVNQNVHCMIG